MPWSSYSSADDAVLPFGREELEHVPRGALGPALRAAREARRMSLQDVAGETRIQLRYLEAIEGARYGEFTGATYAIGFVRAYARAVGVPEVWAVEKLREDWRKEQPGWRRSGWVG